MKKYLLIALCALCACTLSAQEKVMRIHLTNGKSEIRKVSDITKVTFEDYVEPEWPEDPNPPMNGYIKSTFVEGELMYYGKDPEYSPKDCAVYFLYLKDLKNADRATSLGFYVNVPRQQKGGYFLPEGTYTSADTWEPGTFNNKLVAKYKSTWNVVDPKWVQYVVQEGEFTVEKADGNNYTIKGRVKGGSIQDDGSIAVNESGLEFSYTGPLPIEDYSSYYEEEEPEEPELPEEPAVDPDAITMTVGDLMYYGENEYYLNLKDAKPTDTYEITLYLYSAPDGSLELKSGEYTGASDKSVGTFKTENSTWTFIDHDFYNDRVRYKIDEGSVNITSKGGHEYTISGTVKNNAENTTFSFSYSGTLTFEDYSY